MTKIVYCPKCNGEKIKYELLTKHEPERVTMDEWARQPNFGYQTLALRFDKWRATCEGCGYAVEYHLPASSGW